MSYYDDRRQVRRQKRRSIFSGMKLRLLIGGAIVVFSMLRFYSKGQVNPITGETQPVDMTIDQEIRMGIQSAPQMGQLSANRRAQARVEQVGMRLVTRLEQELYRRDKPVRNPYAFEFHLLSDRRTVNAFALPGGQVFITEALFNQLESEDQLAGVLGHEIGHVIERHGSVRMAKGSLIQGLVGAAGVAGGSVSSSNMASYVGKMAQMKYGRNDELESDIWGVRLMLLAQYDPEALLGVMDILEKSAGGSSTPEFLSTHPRPANRKEHIKKVLKTIEDQMGAQRMKELQQMGTQRTEERQQMDPRKMEDLRRRIFE